MLGGMIATTLLTELEDSAKATHKYLLTKMGRYSQTMISEEEEAATIGMRANNDPSEGTFATFTDILCNSGWINLGSAAGIGQSRNNVTLLMAMNHW